MIRNLLTRFVFVAITVFPLTAAAQGSTATVAGVVRDQQNLIVPGVAVTVTGTERTLTRSVTTSSDGGFELAGILPGAYKVSFELAGFAREETSVRIEVNQRIRLDVVMKAGAISQQVEVVETVPLLHLTDAVVGEVIDQRQVAELPLNGRQFLELALLEIGRAHV